MKIAVAANSAWYLHNFRRPLMAALTAAGHDVVALSPPDAYADRLRADGHAWQPLPLDASGTNPLHELATVARWRRLLRDARFDLALTYTPKVNIYTGLAAAGTALAHVPNVSGLGRVFIEPGRLTPLVVALYRLAFGRAASVVFQNDDDRQVFARLRLVRPGQVVRVPGSGIDLQRFVPQPLPPCPPGPVFLFVGRLLRDKGVIELVEAARRLRERHRGAVVRLLGSVDAANPTAVTAAEVRAWADAGVVEYLGRSDDVRPALAAAHVVVLPSYREGVPRSLLEAAATARPCIATDVPGCRDAVDDGVTGWLCPARDPGALAETMARAATAGPAAWSRMGHAGRVKMEREFDEQRVIATYLGLVACRGRAGAPATLSASVPPT